MERRASQMGESRGSRVYYANRRPFFVVVICALMCVISSQQKANAQETSVGTIINEVFKAEHAIANVHVEGFKLTSQQRPDDNGVWQPSKQTIEGEAWYNGLANSKLRIHATKEVSEWINRPAPWAESQWDITYDGQFGRVIHIADGPVDKTRPNAAGLLLPEIPDQLQGNNTIYQYAIGRAFTLASYKTLASYPPLSEWLGQRIAKGDRIDVSSDSVYGAKTLKLSVAMRGTGFFAGTWIDGFWFDPEHGYALRKVEIGEPQPNNGSRVQMLMEVPEIQEAGPGVWMPLVASLERRRNAPQLRLEFHALKVTVNDPSFDEAIYTVPFPKGWTISDRVHGNVFVSTDAKNGDLAIERALKDARTGDALEQSAGQTPPADSEENPGSGFSLWSFGVFAATAGLILVLGAAILLKVRGRKSSLPLILTVMVLSTDRPSLYAAEKDTSDYFEVNCGVNAACFCARWFGGKIDFAETGVELKAGKHFERPCSLGEIRDFCIVHGLNATGLIGDNVHDVLKSVVPGSLAIVKLREEVADAGVGHFIVLVPSNRGFIVVDIPRKPIQLTASEALRDPRLATTTGEFLLVSRDPSKASNGPNFHLLSGEVLDLGRIPIGTNEFSAQIRYENRGTEPVVITAQPSCSCMETPRGDLELPAGKIGFIELPFVRQKVGVGRNERTVLLKTNDPNHSNLKVTIIFDLAETPQQMEVNVAPRSIDIGREKQLAISDAGIGFTLQIPAIDADDYRNATIEVSASTAAIEMKQVSADYEVIRDSRMIGSSTTRPSTLPVGGVGIFEFKGRWLSSPGHGPFSEEISIKISGNKIGVHELTVPIRGEAI